MPPNTRPATETSRPSPGEKMGLAERRAKQIESNSPHVDLDELHTSDGLFAVISQRRGNGTFTFAIFKRFERENKLERTSFIPEELGESYIKLVQLALDRMKAIRDEGSAPFKERFHA